VRPFKKFEHLKIEVFNEVCVLIAALEVLTIMNPAISSEEREFIGWALIITVSANVGLNLLFVSNQVSGDLIIEGGE